MKPDYCTNPNAQQQTGDQAREEIKAEYDVHFSLNGFFRRIEANSPEQAMETAEHWLKKALPDLERDARTRHRNRRSRNP